MNMITKIKEYEAYLIQEEKSNATIEKYMRDLWKFAQFLGNREITKKETMTYKKLLADSYAHTSANSMLVALNGFLQFIGKSDCRVKLLKIQRQMFVSENKELTVAEYRRLLHAAYSTRLKMILQTICEIGIRISELKYITVESVAVGRAVISCKNKTRIIFIPNSLREILLSYIKKSGLKTGSIFVSRNGKPLNRSNIWKNMKALCDRAHVSSEKVFPHNLRHLFARTFYSIEKDIVRLADLLGHSSIQTTRIYTVETGKQHIEYLNRIHSILTT